MEIYRSGNGGKPTIDAGSLKRVNSFNVYHSNIVATASAGTTFDRNLIDNYEYFNVAQTSASTDKIVLPASLPIGTKIVFYAVSAVTIGSAASSGVGFNGQADTATLSLSAGAIVELTKVSATNIKADIQPASGGLSVSQGTNASMGANALVAGSVVVSNTRVTANSRIFLTSNADGGTPGFVRVSAITAGTSFTITSSSGTDTSTIAWLIIEPS